MTPLKRIDTLYIILHTNICCIFIHMYKKDI